MYRLSLLGGMLPKGILKNRDFSCKAAHQEKQGELKCFIIAYKYFAPFVNFLFYFFFVSKLVVLLKSTTSCYVGSLASSSKSH